MGFIDNLHRYVNFKLPKLPIFTWIAGTFVVPYWARRTPVKPLPGGPRYSVQPGDNVQRMMNLIMPLKDKSAIGRAKAAQAIAANKEEIYADNICMFSFYDGDFTNYIRDFIATIGSVFDAVVELVEGGEDVIPSEQNVEKFIDWIHAHDLYQVPDTVTDILRDQEEVNGDTSGTNDLSVLPRNIILQLHVNPNVSLGSGYRAYPGYSVAQVREKFGIGW
jgi:hypothetical protein